MFYANFILAKKGPLAKIWLAAHWEKKLSKAHVFETDLPSSVESIIAPKVKIALRTSGHLLLGVVRIYFRKAKYLLNDCTEAMIKIKMAFRPGLVDLPEDNREAHVAAITLPEFQEWDAIVNDLNNFDIQAQINLNQSRVEEITMKEDLISTNFITDDNFFGDTPFGESNEKEILRAGSALDESNYKDSDVSKITIEEERDIVSADRASANKSTLEMELDAPIRDDGFGGDGFGGEGMDFLGGFGEGEGVIPGFEDLGGEAVPAVEEPTGHDVTLEPLDITLTKDAEEEAEKDDTDNASAEAPAPQVNETTLLPNDQEAFALEPIEITVGKDKRKRRKRKLIVDEKKSLTGDQIRTQISDTSDIVQAATVAPATKRRMQIKESSNVKSLFSMPSIELNADRLLDAFKKNLTAEVSSDGVEIPSQEDEESMEIEMETDQPAGAQKEHHDQAPIPDIDDLPPIEDLGGEITPEITMGNELPDAPEQPEIAELAQEVQEEPEISGKEVAEQEAEENIEEQQDDQLETVDEAQEQKRWTKRAHQMMHTLERELSKKETVTFRKIAGKCSRKQAAYKFYTLLILNKEKAIQVNEEGLYGDISIVKGDEFDNMV